MPHPEHDQRSLNVVRAIKNLETVGKKFNWNPKHKDIKLRLKMFLTALQALHIKV